jgi:hypothetical protein
MVYSAFMLKAQYEVNPNTDVAVNTPATACKKAFSVWKMPFLHIFKFAGR